MNVGAVICARLDSKRLPGKMLADINGRPLLWHVINRLKFCTELDKLIIATTTHDNEIAEFCKIHGLSCFKGDEEDILGRVYQAAKSIGLDIIVRVWGDCPLPSPDLIRETVLEFKDNPIQYLFTKNYPKGQNIAIMPIEMLETWNTNLTDMGNRHWFHVWCTNQKWAVSKVSPADYSKVNLCVDTQEDLDKIREIFKPTLIKIGKRRFAQCWTTKEVNIIDD